MRARIHFRQDDYQGALPRLDQALATSNGDQALWLMRAKCGQRLGRWPIQAESLEHALALGPVPLDCRTELIGCYLAHHDPERALPYLKAVTGKLPRDAAVQCSYASFWDQEHDSAAAEKLFASAIKVNPKFELAYIGLAKNYLDGRRTEDALRIAGQGLDTVPDSEPLLLFKEDALERLGDLYRARLALNTSAIRSGTVELLRRRARLEDWYGDAAPQAYGGLFSALEKQDAPATDLIQVCQRGVYTALRSEQYDAARKFAQAMAALGDNAGLELINSAFYAGQHYPGGIAEAFLNNPRLPQLYVALNSMDRGAAEEIVKRIPLPTLADLWTGSLVNFSAALAVEGDRAQVPGGASADPIWQRLAGADPRDAVEFFQALVRRDEGRLIAFFYTLSELDVPHQRFFTRSFERTQKFYDLFRDSSETRRGVGHRLSENSFLEFLREVQPNSRWRARFTPAI